jgi:hypothetical protein
VVTADGYYDVEPFHEAGEAFLLYDPARPDDPTRGVPDDYFIVENRQQAPGSYDQDARDTGSRSGESTRPCGRARTTAYGQSS